MSAARNPPNIVFWVSKSGLCWALRTTEIMLSTDPNRAMLCVLDSNRTDPRIASAFLRDPVAGRPPAGVSGPNLTDVASVPFPSHRSHGHPRDQSDLVLANRRERHRWGWRLEALTHDECSECHGLIGD